MVGFVVGLELLREATWKKITPNFLLPRVWAVGAFVLQVNCAYRPSYEFHRGFLHELRHVSTSALDSRVPTRRISHI